MAMLKTIGAALFIMGLLLGIYAVVTAKKTKLFDDITELKRIRENGYAKEHHEKERREDIYKREPTAPQARLLSRRAQRVLERMNEAENASNDKDQTEIRGKAVLEKVVPKGETPESPEIYKTTNTSKNLFSGRLPKRRANRQKEELPEIEPEEPAARPLPKEAEDAPPDITPEGTDVLKASPAEGTDVLPQNAPEGTDILPSKARPSDIREEGTDILESPANEEGTAVLNASPEEGTDILDPPSDEEGTAVLGVAPEEGTDILGSPANEEGTAVLSAASEEGTAVLGAASEEGTAVLGASSEEGTDILDPPAPEEWTTILKAPAEEGTDILNTSEATDILERR